MGGQIKAEGSKTWFRKSVCAFLFVIASLSVAIADEDPGARWVSAYAWIQTGDKLAQVKLWPLAIGSYIEADRQIKDLSKAHPGYEPEIVAYRIEKLGEDIESAQAQLTTDEHDIMMKYLDFIESFEEGKKLRFENDFEDALTTLSEARSLLDELIEEKPEEFEVAVETQHELLDDSIDWLYTQVNFKRQSSRVVAVGDGYDWGSTAYVKDSDMPSSKDPVEPFGGLFPEVAMISSAAESEAADGVDSADPDKMRSDSSEEEEQGNARLRFRMNSRSEPAEADPVGEAD